MSAAELVERVGIGELGNFEGCNCTSFSVQGVSVDVSCRKSSSGYPDRDFHGTVVRVYSTSMDSMAEELDKTAHIVVEQMKEKNGTFGSFAVRFCDYRHDAECLCTFCDKPRSDPFAYLCDEHIKDETASRYDYRHLDFKTGPSD